MKLKNVIDRLTSNDPTFKTLILDNLEIDETEVKDNNGLVLLNRLAEAIKLNKVINKFQVMYMAIDQWSLNWSKEGLIAIGKALKDHPTLRTLHLNLTPDQSRGEQISDLLEALTGEANIESLHITIYQDTIGLLSKVGEFLVKNLTLKQIMIEGLLTVRDVEHTKEALSIFAQGLANKSLQKIMLQDLNLSSFGIQAVAEALSNVTTLKSLIFTSCNLTVNCIPPLARIFKANPMISQLNLSSNPLASPGIKELAKLLPLLPGLKNLELSNTKLNSEGLESLAEIWYEHKLQIRDLVISDNLDVNCIKAIMKIIHGNKYLKSFRCNNDSIEDHLPLLQELLSDPRKFYLQEFGFTRNRATAGDDLENALIQILTSSVHLRRISPDYGTDYFWSALKQNDIRYRDSQNIFVNNVMKACNIYFSEPANQDLPHIKMLFRDVFLIILCHLGEGTLGMHEDQIKECCQLIFDNFSYRRKLIEDKKYIPVNKDSSSNESVSLWWSKTPRDKINKTIFCSRTGIISNTTVEKISDKNDKKPGL